MLNLYGNGITCHDKECPFNRECANHETAGQFRTEGGFSPKFSMCNGVITCHTRTANPVYEEFKTVPFGVETMDRGEVCMNKYGTFTSSDPWTMNEHGGYLDRYNDS